MNFIHIYINGAYAKTAKELNWRTAIKINLFAYASAAEFAFSVYLFEWRRYKREKINSLSWGQWTSFSIFINAPEEHISAPGIYLCLSAQLSSNVRKHSWNSGSIGGCMHPFWKHLLIQMGFSQKFELSHQDRWDGKAIQQHLRSKCTGISIVCMDMCRYMQ